MDNEKLEAEMITEISTHLKEKSETKIDEKYVRHLAKMGIKAKQTAEFMADVFLEKLSKVSSKKRGARKLATALNRTSAHMKRLNRTSAKTVIGFVVGTSHRINDMSGDKLKEAKKEWNKIIELADEDEFDKAEIDDKEYRELFDEYNKLKKTSVDDAIDFLEKGLDGRWVVPQEPKEGSEEVPEPLFIDKMARWKSGSVNFDFGKVLESKPARTMGMVYLDNDQPKYISVSVKQQERIDKLNAAEMYKLSMITVVPNRDKKKSWYVDASFNIEPLENGQIEKILGSKTEDGQIKKMMSMVYDAVPESLQVDPLTVDEWERTRSKKTKKKNHVALVTGTVFFIQHRDNGGLSIELKEEDVDIDDFDMYDDEEDDEEENGSIFKLSLTPEKAKMVDFEEDSEISAIVEIYRGKKWDSEARKATKEDNEMPTGNVWGIIADPDFKQLAQSIAPVSSDTFETNDTEEETVEDSGFVVEV